MNDREGLPSVDFLVSLLDTSPSDDHMSAGSPEQTPSPGQSKEGTHQYRFNRRNSIRWRTNKMFDTTTTELFSKVTKRRANHSAMTPSGDFRFQTSHMFTPYNDDDEKLKGSNGNSKKPCQTAAEASAQLKYSPAPRSGMNLSWLNDVGPTPSTSMGLRELLQITTTKRSSTQCDSTSQNLALRNLLERGDASYSSSLSSGAPEIEKLRDGVQQQIAEIHQPKSRTIPAAQSTQGAFSPTTSAVNGKLRESCESFVAVEPPVLKKSTLRSSVSAAQVPSLCLTAPDEIDCIVNQPQHTARSESVPETIVQSRIPAPNRDSIEVSSNTSGLVSGALKSPGPVPNKALLQPPDTLSAAPQQYVATRMNIKGSPGSWLLTSSAEIVKSSMESLQVAGGLPDLSYEDWESQGLPHSTFDQKNNAKPQEEPPIDDTSSAQAETSVHLFGEADPQSPGKENFANVNTGTGISMKEVVLSVEKVKPHIDDQFNVLSFRASVLQAEQRKKEPQVNHETEHDLLRRSITDVVIQQSAGVCCTVEEELQTSISDITPIDLNPPGTGQPVVPQMPLFSQKFSSDDSKSSQSSRNHNSEDCRPVTIKSGIPFRPPDANVKDDLKNMSPPDSPCSRSLKTSAMATSSQIPPLFGPQQTRPSCGSSKCPPVPKLHLPKSPPPAPRSHYQPSTPPKATENSKRSRAVALSPLSTVSSQPSSPLLSGVSGSESLTPDTLTPTHDVLHACSPCSPPSGLDVPSHCALPKSQVPILNLPVGLDRMKRGPPSLICPSSHGSPAETAFDTRKGNKTTVRKAAKKPKLVPPLQLESSFGFPSGFPQPNDEYLEAQGGVEDASCPDTARGVRWSLSFPSNEKAAPQETTDSGCDGTCDNPVNSARRSSVHVASPCSARDHGEERKSPISVHVLTPQSLLNSPATQERAHSIDAVPSMEPEPEVCHSPVTSGHAPHLEEAGFVVRTPFIDALKWLHQAEPAAESSSQSLTPVLSTNSTHHSWEFWRKYWLECAHNFPFNCKSALNCALEALRRAFLVVPESDLQMYGVSVDPQVAVNPSELVAEASVDELLLPSLGEMGYESEDQCIFSVWWKGDMCWNSMLSQIEDITVVADSLIDYSSVQQSAEMTPIIANVVSFDTDLEETAQIDSPGLEPERVHARFEECETLQAEDFDEFVEYSLDSPSSDDDYAAPVAVSSIGTGTESHVVENIHDLHSDSVLGVPAPVDTGKEHLAVVPQIPHTEAQMHVTQVSHPVGVHGEYGLVKQGSSRVQKPGFTPWFDMGRGVYSINAPVEPEVLESCPLQLSITGGLGQQDGSDDSKLVALHGEDAVDINQPLYVTDSFSSPGLVSPGLNSDISATQGTPNGALAFESNLVWLTRLVLFFVSIWLLATKTGVRKEITRLVKFMNSLDRVLKVHLGSLAPNQASLDNTEEHIQHNGDDHVATRSIAVMTEHQLPSSGDRNDPRTPRRGPNSEPPRIISPSRFAVLQEGRSLIPPDRSRRQQKYR